MRSNRLKCSVAVLVFAASLAALVSGCGGPVPLSTDWSPKVETVKGLAQIAHTEGTRLLLSTQGGPVDFVPGVNLGSTIPGYQPGELATSREDYRRWFPEMASLGLHGLRIYTILLPAFYEELVAFNGANPEKALYLIQGVWIPEEEFLTSHDLFDPMVRDGFRSEIGDAVSAVHGTLKRSESPEAAWGQWTADVSPWLYAYSIGVEWDPAATAASDEKNADHPAYSGTYFSSAEAATPTEIWLAEMLDLTAEKEANLGRTMPLTFTNWPTTDPLRHPDEPLDREDLVGVDANHIAVSPQWPGGYFASYHAYPYYPDFQRHEPGLQTTVYDGKSDPYAGYLKTLQDHHRGMPVMITEFGVPSSMSLAHYGPLGRDQGNHSEQKLMAIDAQLLRMIHDLGFAGGFAFEWTDEWFKFTWNTIEYELPSDRRQLWVNPWTNEEHFGLVATDPGATAVVILDGEDREWSDNSSQVIYEGSLGLREVRAVKDEGYLYLRMVVDEPDLWKKTPITIGIDVISGGNGGLPGLAGQDPEADYAVVLGPDKAGQAYVRASNDQYAILWGKVKKYVPYDEAALREGSGVWNEEKLITNRPLTIPSTGEQLPVESVNAGQMRFGTTDPSKNEFDSRSTWCADKCVEIRLPYAAIGFSDPSSLQALRVGVDGVLTSETVDRVGISIAVGQTVYQTKGYGWEPWQTVQWHERIKSGAKVFEQAAAAVTAR